MPDVVMTSKEAAEYLGYSPMTMEVYRSRRRLDIPYFKDGKCVKYLKKDLDAWLIKQPRYKGGLGKS